MATPSRFSGKLILAALLIVCAGAAFWFTASEAEKTALLTPVKEQAQNLLGGFGFSFADKSAEEGAQTTSADAGKNGEGSAREFSAPLSTDSRAETEGGDAVQGKLSEEGAPEDALLARVDKALAESGPSAADGDSVSGTLSDNPPERGVEKDDSVVTGAFVQDLAQWLAANYRPPRQEGRTGYSVATLERANSRYANSPRLRSVEQDALRGRASILRYVYTPGMMEALYLLYSPRFLAELESAARQPSRGNPLENWQLADMFTVYGERFQKLASSLDAVSKVDLPALVRAIVQAGQKERDASEAFAIAYTAHAVALDAKRQEEADIQNSRMMEQTRLAEIYAGKQEQARRRLVSEIRSHSAATVLSNSDLLFLGEWIARHNGSVEATQAAASVCARLAAQCRERAQALASAPKAQESAPTSPEVSAPAEANTSTAETPKDSASVSPEAPVKTPEAAPQAPAPAELGTMPASSPANGANGEAQAPNNPASVEAPSATPAAQESPAPASSEVPTPAKANTSAAETPKDSAPVSSEAPVNTPEAAPQAPAPAEASTAPASQTEASAQ